MDIVNQQRHKAGARDAAVEKLRDLTLAIAIAATGGVGVIAWMSAATIPGNPGSTGATPAASTNSGDQSATSAGGFIGVSNPGGSLPGSGVVVSGASR